MKEKNVKLVSFFYFSEKNEILKTDYQIHFKNHKIETSKMCSIFFKKCCICLLQIASLLFEYGAQGNIPNREQNTALHLAASCGHEWPVNLLSSVSTQTTIAVLRGDFNHCTAE